MIVASLCGVVGSPSLFISFLIGRTGNILSVVLAGVTWEDSTEGGGKTGCLSKVLLRSNTGCDVVWGRDLVFIGANGTETGGSSCGVPATGEKVEGKEAEGRFVAEDVGGQITSVSGVTTTSDLLGQNSGDNGVMVGLTSYL